MTSITLQTWTFVVSQILAFKKTETGTFSGRRSNIEIRTGSQTVLVEYFDHYVMIEDYKKLKSLFPEAEMKSA